VKYSILPQALSATELVGGNALVESATSLAILLGLIAGGLLMALADGATAVSIAVLLVAKRPQAAAKPAVAKVA